MADKKPLKWKSYLYRGLVVLLAVLLLFTIRYPKGQWEEQAANRTMIRSKLADISKMSFQHYFFHRYFTENLDSMIAHIRTDTLPRIMPMTIIWERKQVDLGMEGTRDSLLIDFEDRFHGDTLLVLQRDAGEVDIVIVPQELYTGLGTDTLRLIATDSIRMIHRVGGLAETAWWASTPLEFRSVTIVRGDTVSMPIVNYIFENPIDEMTQTPLYHEVFQLYNLLKLTYAGTIDFQLQGEPLDSSLLVDEKTTLLFFDLFKNDLKEQYTTQVTDLATRMRKKLENPDYELPRDSIVNIIEKEMRLALADLATMPRPASRRSRQVVTYNSQLVTANSLTCRSDSLAFFQEFENVQETVFPLMLTPDMRRLYKKLLEEEDLQAILRRIQVTTSFAVAGIDTVGQAVYAPIPEEAKQRRSLFDRIFGVDLPEDHGFIYGNTRSWEE
ncbi:MAG: hypothetical protein ISR91_05220 [Candidatus Delongbacteria bacterium]|nr:hypothetical protein [Candidatus Delongbacteria bacterium]